MDEVLSNLVQSAGEEYTHPLIEVPKEVKSVLIIAVASDRGQCGSFNTNIFRNVKKFIDIELPAEYPNAIAHVIPVGKRTCGFFRKEPYDLIKEFSGIFQNLQFSVAKEIATIAKTKFVSGEVQRVYIFFNEFKNMMTQIPSMHVILPFEPKKIAAAKTDKYNIDYIYEPDQKSILDNLLPKNLDIQIWRTLLESFAAEQAARMMAMESATNNSNEIVKHLELVFNKERQAAITKEMLEIVSGANALKKS